MTANIMVVEDDAAIRELLRINLQREGHQVTCAASAEEAYDLVPSQFCPDLILLDWLLPGHSGIDFAKRLKAHNYTKHIPIIMVTALRDEQEKVSALSIGADDYITKPFSPKELNARIKAVLRRYAPQATDDIINLGGICLNPVNHRVTVDGNNLELRPIEFKLLHFFLTHPERVFSRTQLLDQVWGNQSFVEDRNIDVHIRRLRSVLENSGHDSLIQTVRGSGYRLSLEK